MHSMCPSFLFGVNGLLLGTSLEFEKVNSSTIHIS